MSSVTSNRPSTIAATPNSGVVGKPLDRVDGRLKVTGAAHYSADIPVTDLSYGVIFDSAIAKGRILNIDTSAAEAAPGVLGIITHLNAPKLNPVNMFPHGPFGESLVPLQQDTIYYSGQHLGIVIAETFEQATYAASLVKVAYAEEPAIASLKDALFQGKAPHKPPSETFAHGKDDAILKIPTAEEPPPGTFAHGGDATRGNLEQGLAEADVCIDQTYDTQVIHHNPMELSATTAVWEGEQLTLYDATQWIYGDRNAVATMLGIPQAQVRIISHFVGGGFGCKCFTWSHVILAAIAAKHVGRPVKVVLTREQMFMSVGYRASSSQHIRLGAKRDGTLTAISHAGIVQTSTFTNYPTPVGLLTPMVYACPHLVVKHYLMHVNAGTPTQMRAPGEAPGMFALESAMDELAYELQIDPIELRLRNHADFDPQSGKPWSSKSLKQCYEQGAKRFGWERRNPEPGSMQDNGFLVGWGMATAAYPIYLSPAAARVKIFADGHAVAQSGSHEIGNGTYTVMTQIAAEELGLPPEQVQFELGDTNLPNTPITGASRTVGSVGPAVQAAAKAARSKVVQMAIADTASPLYGVKEQDVAVSEGRLFVQDNPTHGETYRDILARHHLEVVEAYQETFPRDADTTDRDKVFSGINALRGPVDSQYAMYNFGAHFAEVRINPVSMEVRVSRYVGAFATGRILNPKTAGSQILGGIVMGVGMALLEETVTDPNLGRIATASLADYHVPAHIHIAGIETFFVEEHDPFVNALGTKSVGEISTVGSAAAIANAVYHATGKRVRDLPIRLEKLLENP